MDAMHSPSGDRSLVFTRDISLAVQWHAVLRPLGEVAALQSFSAANQWFANAAEAKAKPVLVTVLDHALLTMESEPSTSLQAWRSLVGRTPLILAGMEFSVGDELAALAGGVAACCDRRLPGGELARITRIVIDGGVWVSALTLPNLLARLRTVASQDALPSVVASTTQPGTLNPPDEPIHAALAVLTERQRAVANLVAAGSNNKEIARALDITERTVKAHLTEIFDRLEVSDRLQLSIKLNRK